MPKISASASTVKGNYNKASLARLSAEKLVPTFRHHYSASASTFTESLADDVYSSAFSYRDSVSISDDLFANAVYDDEFSYKDSVSVSAKRASKSITKASQSASLASSVAVSASNSIAGARSKVVSASASLNGSVSGKLSAISAKTSIAKSNINQASLDRQNANSVVSSANREAKSVSSVAVVQNSQSVSITSIDNSVANASASVAMASESITNASTSVSQFRSQAIKPIASFADYFGSNQDVPGGKTIIRGNAVSTSGLSNKEILSTATNCINRIRTRFNNYFRHIKWALKHFLHFKPDKFAQAMANGFNGYRPEEAIEKQLRSNALTANGRVKNSDFAKGPQSDSGSGSRSNSGRGPSDGGFEL